MITSSISPDTNYSESDLNEVDPILTIDSELERRLKNLEKILIKSECQTTLY